MKQLPSVDVIIATYNEEKNIVDCVNSVLKQTYPNEYIHLYIVDGHSSDNTLSIIKKLAAEHKNIAVLENPERYQAFAWNKAIKFSESPYISIISAHSVLPPDYLENAIKLLQLSDIDLTGGHMVAKGKGYISSAVAALHHSKFGIGVGNFHNMSFEGYTETVYTFNLKRELLERVGAFNTSLVRNQDIELAGRIRKKGGKIYLSSKLDAIYTPRNSIISFVKQYFNNAAYLFETIKSTSSSLSIRHFVPFFFVLFVLASIYLFLMPELYVLRLLASIVWLLYFLLDLFFSVKLADTIKQFLLLFLLHPLLHVVYGIGTFWGGIMVVYNSIIKH